MVAKSYQNGRWDNIVPACDAGKPWQNKHFQTQWESTSLVARTVFKTAEAVARRLVGSIPTLSRRTRAVLCVCSLRKRNGTPILVIEAQDTLDDTRCDPQEVSGFRSLLFVAAARVASWRRRET